jgi:uncharacterized tellurite resistance protein B-like protein
MGWLGGFFSKKGAGDDPERSEAIERIQRALAGVPPAEARFLACVALLAARVAHVDSEVSPGERERIRGVLKTRLGLADALADAATGIALDATAAHAVEQHLVIRRLNELATRERKHQLVRALFEVASEADVTEAESAEIGVIATGLLLSRSEFIALRSEFRESLAILKGLP